MLVTNHVLSGAVIGAAVRRPVPAFLLGVASHFALDSIPHWGKWSSLDQFLRVAAADGLTGLTGMAVFTAVAPPGRRVAVAAGMAGAALPDIDKPFWMLFGFPPFPMAVIRFHGRIQDEARHRFPVEAVSAGIFAASALMLLRADAKRRVSGR